MFGSLFPINVYFSKIISGRKKRKTERDGRMMWVGGRGLSRAEKEGGRELATHGKPGGVLELSHPRNKS